jgi:cytochrome c oxidase subunit 2
VTAPPTDAEPQKESMGIDPYERNWIRFSIVLLGVFLTAITVAGFAMGFQVPGEEARVDPSTITETGPFSNPGLREVAPGEFEAYVVSRTFNFDPAEIVVPQGATVTIYVTSQDVQHGFKITDTNVNMQIVPGQVSKLTYTFDEAGEFPYICTEYCGQGHAAMYGTVKVVSEAEYEASKTDSTDSTDSDETAEADG